MSHGRNPVSDIEVTEAVCLAREVIEVGKDV
jgi:hypothetical protein